ncbi:MAG: protein-tyrosine phosphatase family protein [Armatimonadota bacterium]
MEPDSFEVLEGVIRCSQPWTESQIHWLYERGVRAMVSLEPLDSGLVQTIQSLGIDHLVLDVPDMSLPTSEQVDKFVAFMEAQTAARRTVAIHCAMGRGRTGTMYALWLVSRGVSGEAAIQQAGTLETESQREFVRRFAAAVVGAVQSLK